MKKVKIGIELSNTFVSLLRNNMTIREAIPPNETHELSVLEVLGLVVLGESMGAYPEDIWSKIPQKWRTDIDAISEMREVKEE